MSATRPAAAKSRATSPGAEPGRVAKAVLIGAVPPIMVKSDKNPGGLPIEVFDGFRAALAANRAQFYLDVPTGPFYGFNRPGAKVSQGVIDNWWRQGMMGGAKAHYDCIKAFSETDFTEDLKKIDVPVLVMHGDDDQIVPYRRLRAAVGQAAQERHAEDLRGPAARHVHHASRHHQPGPARLHQGLAPSITGRRPPRRFEEVGAGVGRIHAHPGRRGQHRAGTSMLRLELFRCRVLTQGEVGIMANASRKHVNAALKHFSGAKARRERAAGQARHGPQLPATTVFPTWTPSIPR